MTSGKVGSGETIAMMALSWLFHTSLQGDVRNNRGEGWNGCFLHGCRLPTGIFYPDWAWLNDHNFM